MVENSLLEPDEFDDYMNKELNWDGTCPACISSEDGRRSELITCLTCKIIGCERDGCDGYEIDAIKRCIDHPKRAYCQNCRGKGGPSELIACPDCDYWYCYRDLRRVRDVLSILNHNIPNLALSGQKTPPTSIKKQKPTIRPTWSRAKGASELRMHGRSVLNALGERVSSVKIVHQMVGLSAPQVTSGSVTSARHPGYLWFGHVQSVGSYFAKSLARV